MIIHQRGSFGLADIWANQFVTRGILWSNGVVPRGPVMGCHVAPLYWLLVFGLFIKILWRLWGSTPGPPHRLSLHSIRPTTIPRIDS
jgi:hypothetical protein